MAGRVCKIRLLCIQKRKNRPPVETIVSFYMNECMSYTWASIALGSFGKVKCYESIPKDMACEVFCKDASATSNNDATNNNKANNDTKLPTNPKLS
eukprot:6233347-Amphidinium_carterae.1